MGLQINTNTAALNAYRNLSGTQGQMATSLERLSSGLRINRAADDAAGLAISEKLRSQISGLNQASSNAQDGISLIQTGEGALNASTSILQRMRQLSVQASNDTNTDTDRAQIQKEVDQLSQELTRIGATTQFNGKNLLDGSQSSGLKLQIGANTGQNLSVSLGDMRGYALGATGAVTSNVVAAPATAASITGSAAAVSIVTAGNFNFTLDGVAKSAALLAGDTAAAAVTKINTAAGATVASLDGTGKLVLTSATSGASSNITALGTSTGSTLANLGMTAGQTSTGTAAVVAPTVANSGLEAGGYNISTTGAVTDANGTAIGNYTAGTGLIKDTTGTKTLATLTNGPAAGTGFSLTVGGVNVSTQAAATQAMTTVDAALAKVTDQRSTLGAVQNRLQYTISNLGVAAENLTASESRIRDTDMAKEMTAFSRAQILQSAGVSMLAQANQAPQSVLKLLG